MIRGVVHEKRGINPADLERKSVVRLAETAKESWLELEEAVTTLTLPVYFWEESCSKSLNVD